MSVLRDADGLMSLSSRPVPRTLLSPLLPSNAAGPSYRPFLDAPLDPISPTSAYSDYFTQTFPTPYTPISMSPTGSQYANPLSPTLGSRNAGPLPSPGLGYASDSSLGRSVGPGAPQAQAAAAPHTTDPNNTTVFVGGLPTCISEETLKARPFHSAAPVPVLSFFHHFGEITYCKIPTGKGCGFIQFVRREAAELAIQKMNDFPIHGKSRIRLSWGRSQGDKQVEHIRKLASALNVPLNEVWRMVQGQDNSTIKQISNAVGPPVLGSRLENFGVGRMDLGAVASAAGLTEAEVLELVGGRGGSHSVGNGGGVRSGGGSNPSIATRNPPDFFSRSSGLPASVSPHDGTSSGGPYSRVSPSTFSAFSSTSSSSQNLPLSPPPSAGSFGHSQQMQHQQALAAHSHHPQAQAGYGPPSPYTSIRPDSYLVNSPPSPYERVDFAEGGVPHGARQYQPPVYQSYPPRYAPQPIYHQHSLYQPSPQQHQQPPHHQQQHYRPKESSQGAYSNGGLEDSFANLRVGLSTPPPSAGLRSSVSHRSYQSSPGHDFFQAMSPGPGNAKLLDEGRARASYAVDVGDRILGHSHGPGAQWGAWNGASDVQA